DEKFDDASVAQSLCGIAQSLVSAAPTQQPPVFVGGRLFFSIAEYPIYYSKLILQCQDFFREHRTAGNRFFAHFL
ncbi:hypothetical protein, partial [Ruminococcus callidus]|uniref:hypothetical protein n=1 Tax=Ruminococcus callidus TaxID=40519 RepID=UPI003FD8D081